jgi:hypothetical protein
MTLTLELPQRKVATRPLGPDYAEALQRQSRHRNVTSSWSWSVIPELAAESPPNFAFLREREVAKIRSFAELRPDWDSYGAAAISHLAIQSAIELVQKPAFIQLLPYYSPRLAAFPLRNGGIQLDLNGGKAPLEIEIAPSGEREFTLFGPDEEMLWEAPTLALAIQLYQDFDPVSAYPG